VQIQVTLAVGELSAEDGTITLIAKGTISGKEDKDYKLRAKNIYATSEEGDIHAHSYIATGDIHLEALLGDIYIGTINAQIKDKSYEGDISLEAKCLITDNDIQPLLAKNISLKATKGQVGALDNYFNVGSILGIDGLRQTTLTVHSLGDICVRNEGGDLILNSIISNEGSVYLIVGGSIFRAMLKD
jgi:hypothetical protein